VTYAYGKHAVCLAPQLATENGHRLCASAAKNVQSRRRRPAPNFPILGTELFTRSFTMGGGKEVEARLRLRGPARGIVAAIWLYGNHGSQSEPSQPGYSSDEIDLESCPTSRVAMFC
jgi:hypothetical protein